MTVRGIAIEINHSWIILFGLLLFSVSSGLAPGALRQYPPVYHWIAGLIATVALVIALLLHELAHSLVARSFGIKVSRITLFMFGGVSQMEEEPPTAASEFWMAVVGPATSMVIGALAYSGAIALKIGGGNPMLEFIVWYVGVSNLALAVFNLLPGFPLDGGRVLRSILWRTWGDLDRATRAAAKLGQAVGYGLIILGGLNIFMPGGGIGGLWLVAIGWLLAGAAAQSYERRELERILGNVSVGALMSSPAVTIPAEISLDEAINRYFLPLRHGAFPVQGDDGPVGMIALNQIRAIPRDQWPQRTVGQVAEGMNPETMAVNPETDGVRAMLKMAETGRGRLMVLDGDGRLVGIISQSDIMRLVRARAGPRV